MIFTVLLCMTLRKADKIFTEPFFCLISMAFIGIEGLNSIMLHFIASVNLNNEFQTKSNIYFLFTAAEKTITLSFIMHSDYLHDSCFKLQMLCLCCVFPLCLVANVK